MSEKQCNPDWDDNLLIKAYDNSANLAHEDIARRIADATNRRATENAEMAAAEADEGTKTAGEKKYKVGQFVRATYVDGEEYEGTIVSINADAGTCVVRYVGYENEEEVILDYLMPSLGKKKRREQRDVAKGENSETSYNEQSAKKGKKPDKTAGGAHLLVPPQPPYPPMLESGFLAGETSQDLAAMLMSWYMSGYYTGLYQGKMAKQKKSAKK